MALAKVAPIRETDQSGYSEARRSTLHTHSSQSIQHRCNTLLPKPPILRMIRIIHPIEINQYIRPGLRMRQRMRELCDLSWFSTSNARDHGLSALIESRGCRAGGGGLLEFYGSDMVGDGHGVFAVALDAVVRFAGAGVVE